MKIYFASPGIDTGMFSINQSINQYNLLFSFWDLSGIGVGITIMRKRSFQKIIEEKKDERE